MKYNPIDDSLALIGMLTTDRADTMQDHELRSILDAETAEDFFYLSTSVAAIAAGLMMALTEDDPQQILRLMARDRDAIRSMTDVEDRAEDLTEG